MNSEILVQVADGESLTADGHRTGDAVGAVWQQHGENLSTGGDILAQNLHIVAQNGARYSGVS